VKRRLIFCLSLMLLLAAASGEVFGQKKKYKDKRYEPATRATVKDYEGKYVGVESSYWIDIFVSPEGKLSINSYEGERRATLNDIKLEGAIISAVKVYEDGGSENFSGVFANRILNGQSAFGIIVDNVQVKVSGVTLHGLFYRLREESLSHAPLPIETDARVARAEIEARYNELAEAVRNKDFAAFQSLRTEDFRALAHDGEMQDNAQMAARARKLLDRIQPPINVSNTIETFILLDNEAIAIVHQNFSRMQKVEGVLHLIETSVRQREMWVKTGEGWKLKFVDGVRDQQTFVDGVEVQG
jgi:ketosteroid isomerase-like protein